MERHWANEENSTPFFAADRRDETSFYVVGGLHGDGRDGGKRVGKVGRGFYTDGSNKVGWGNNTRAASRHYRRKREYHDSFNDPTAWRRLLHIFPSSEMIELREKMMSTEFLCWTLFEETRHAPGCQGRGGTCLMRDFPSPFSDEGRKNAAALLLLPFSLSLLCLSSSAELGGGGLRERDRKRTGRRENKEERERAGGIGNEVDGSSRLNSMNQRDKRHDDDDDDVNADRVSVKFEKEKGWWLGGIMARSSILFIRLDYENSLFCLSDGPAQSVSQLRSSFAATTKMKSVCALRIVNSSFGRVEFPIVLPSTWSSSSSEKGFTAARGNRPKEINI